MVWCVEWSGICRSVFFTFHSPDFYCFLTKALYKYEPPQVSLFIPSRQQGRFERTGLKGHLDTPFISFLCSLPSSHSFSPGFVCPLGWVMWWAVWLYLGPQFPLWKRRSCYGQFLMALPQPFYFSLRSWFYVFLFPSVLGTHQSHDTWCNCWVCLSTALTKSALEFSRRVNLHTVKPGKEWCSGGQEYLSLRHTSCQVQCIAKKLTHIHIYTHTHTHTQMMGLYLGKT
jgi:hypothetical protein